MPSPPTQLETITLVVLAGGAGSRMGKPKGHLEINRQPILTLLLDQLVWPGPTMLVTSPGRERPPGADRFGAEVTDPVTDEGPLRGVHTALRNLRTKLAIVIAVDMPAVTRADLEWFTASLSSRGPDCLGVMTTRNGNVEPLPCALRAGAIELVEQHLSTGRRSLHGLAKDTRVCTLDAGDLPDRVWLNVNTPAEWEHFLRTVPGESSAG